MSNNENSKLVVVQNFIDGQFEASDTYLDSLEPGNGRHSVQINEKNVTKKYLHNLLNVLFTLLEKKTNKDVCSIAAKEMTNLSGQFDVSLRPETS